MFWHGTVKHHECSGKWGTLLSYLNEHAIIESIFYHVWFCLLCLSQVAPPKSNQLSTDEGRVPFSLTCTSYRYKCVQGTIQNYDRYSLIAPSQVSNISLPLWLISGMHAFIWTSYTAFFFLLGKKKKKKERRQRNLETCQHASKNIECLFQNQKWLANINPKTYKYDWSENTRNNSVQTKTATSTLKKKKRKSFYIFVYTHTRLASPVLLALDFSRF